MGDLIKLFQHGQLQQLTQWLFLVNVIDVLSGFIKAVDSKTVSSRVMRHGALTKLIIWVVVLVSGIVSSYFNTDFTTYVIGYYLIMEIVSIFENASNFVPIPDKLKSILNTNNIQEETSSESTSTVDPEILSMIKEKENE